MDIKESFFDILSEVQEDLQEVFAGIFFVINAVHKNFVVNLMSKLVRSTWTSPKFFMVKSDYKF
jgi:hypothetical protein